MLKLGAVLDGKYKIISVIGQGGMSTVYLARHQRLNKEWAVKEISREYCENYEMISRQLVLEADILKKLNHPGLPKIIDIIEKKDVIWMVMEFIEGKTLKEVLKERGRIQETEVLSWGKQLCEVLSYLHSRTPPIIYRDLKPDNIILKKTGRLVLIDFGTAREYCYEKNSTDTTYLGTRGYAAPEQYGGMGQTDERTDIYCLGVTLYSMLTGYSPEKPPYKIYHQQYWGENISCEIKEVILKCIQLEPDMRYQNCKELSYAFSQVDYKNHNFLKTEKRKVKKLIVFIVLLQISGMFSLGCKGAAHFYKEKAIAVYIESAEKSIDKKKAEQYYKQALLLIPDEKAIYQSLVKYFIHPNNFSVEDASILTSVVMTTCKEKTVLDIFKENKREGYMEFCYEVGLGYFYDMGGVTGKSASEKWFCDVVDLLDDGKKEKTFDEGKKKRVIAYANIAKYYNTFLINGVDKSGERENKDFLDFYNELCILNQFKITERSSTSDSSAAYLISTEVAIEIANYADEFLRMKEINREMLKKQLIKINGRMRYFEKTKKNGKELENLLQDAQRRVEMADGFKYEGDEGDEGGT